MPWEHDTEQLTGPALLEIALGLIRAVTGSAHRAAPESLRCGLRLMSTPAFDVWLLRWPAATSVTPHDHGSSVGALAVAHGQLREVRWSGGQRIERNLSAGEGMVVEQGQVHDVIGVSPGSISVHVYSPPLSTMSYYDEQGASVVYEEAVDPSDDYFGPGGPDGRAIPGVDRVLMEARRRIAPRAQPEDLDAAMAAGTLVVDTRPADLRQRDGVIPGALQIERNVLEWRLDPTGSHRVEDASDPDRPVIVVCDEGYASSLAAASLLDLGRRNVTDLQGGFQAWRSLPRQPLVLRPG